MSTPPRHAPAGSPARPLPAPLNCSAEEHLTCLLAALAPHPLLAALRQAYALGVRTGPLSPDELRAADAVLAPAERKARGDRKQRIRSARERLARLLAANPVPETDRSGPAA